MSPCYSRQAPATGRDRRCLPKWTKCSQTPDGAVRHAGQMLRRGALYENARRYLQPPKLRTSPRPRWHRQTATAASQPAWLKHAPQTRPYMSAAASPTLTPTLPPPAGLSTGAGAWRPETRPVAIKLPPSGNLGSLALSMASTIAQPRTLVKRASAIIALRCCPVRLSADQTP